MRLSVALVGLFFLLGLVSCSKPESAPVHRLDQALFQVRTSDSIRAFLAQNPSVAQLYFNANPANTDTLVAELAARVNNPDLRRFYDQIQTEFGDMTPLRRQLGEAFTRIKQDFPGFRPPRIVTMVSGFMGPDLVLSDSLIIIGLDYFVGPKALYRPEGPDFPQYILRRYEPSSVVPRIVLALSEPFNAADRADQTLLADMVYAGKGYVFTKQMLPDTPDSLIIGYTDKQLTDTFNNQGLVWGHFIDNQLLYQTNSAIKSRYMNERPFTAEIGKACPGAIGRWLGWRIVGLYHDDHPNVPLSELMQNPNARQIFEQSGYKGQTDK